MEDSQRLAGGNEVDEGNCRKRLSLGSRLTLCLTLALFSSLLVLIKTYSAPQNRTLVVLSGHPGELTVTEMGGRYFVDVEALTRIANGSLSFRGNQIVLTLPTTGAINPQNNLDTGQSAASGFSKGFLSGGGEVL